MKLLYKYPVAPRAGAWIETKVWYVCEENGCWSRPVRARGLKHPQAAAHHDDDESRPVRARGLKLEAADMGLGYAQSRPVRARGLKLASALADLLHD